MIVHAVRIEESVDLETMKTQTCVVFRLPTGKYFRGTISDEEGMQALVEAAAVNSQGQHVDVDERIANGDVPLPVPEPPMPEPMPSSDDKVDWQDLPPTVLSPLMKAAFAKLGVAPALSMLEVRRLTDNITENFGPADWDAVRATMGPQVPQVPEVVKVRPAPANTLSPNKPMWADGSPMVAGTGAPFRTVPKDEWGYPVMSGEVDPGEVVGGVTADSDEDGVSQF